MGLREEFESTISPHAPYSDRHFVKWLLNEMAECEFQMGECNSDQVLTEKYDELLTRADEITGEIIGLFPVNHRHPATIDSSPPM